MSGKTLLVLKTSLQTSGGHSGVLVDHFVAQYLRQHPQATIIEHDFAAQPLPHLVENSFTTDDGDKLSQQLINELKQADEVVVGMPMYNLSAPSTFKSWVDQIFRPDFTFKFTDSGLVGLVADKPVTVLHARGGLYAGTEFDTQMPWLNLVFGFIGIRSVQHIFAEGLAMGDEPRDQALNAAKQQIEQRFAA